MEPDLKAIYEVHFEEYLEKVQDDYDLRNLIWEVFADPMDYYRYCKEDYWDEQVEDLAFEIMYEWDADYFVSDPMHAIVDYVTSQKLKECTADEKGECECKECEAYKEKEMAFHLGEYRRYGVPGPDGRTVDVREVGR